VKKTSTSKKCLLIASSHATNSLSGASLRVKKIEKTLLAAGFDVEITNSKKVSYASTNDQYDLGVIVSFSQIFCYFKIRSKCSILWLDSTDSLFRTRSLGLGSNCILSRLKGLLEMVLSLTLRNRFFLVTYISELDMTSDRLLFKNSRKFVVPNETMDNMLKSIEQSRQVFFVGDYTYNANRKAIKFLEKSLAKDVLHQNFELVIVSNRFPIEKIKSFKNGNRIKYSSFVSAEILYAAGTVHLAPIWNSVGIKNKIVEPASLGLKVFGGLPAFNGLFMLENMRANSIKRNFILELNAFLEEELSGETSVKNLFLRDETSKVIEVLSESLP
jgi:hypothetical protein